VEVMGKGYALLHTLGGSTRPPDGKGIHQTDTLSHACAGEASALAGVEISSPDARLSFTTVF